MALAYHTTHGLDVVVTRSSNTYGPYQHPEKLIPLVVGRAVADRSPPLYGDGLHVRDWIHVDDHCRGLLLAAEVGTAGHVYNFGGDAERTNLSVARTVLEILRKPESLIDFVEDRPGHDRRYAVDFSRATDELGWVAVGAVCPGAEADREVVWRERDLGGRGDGGAQIRLNGSSEATERAGSNPTAAMERPDGTATAIFHGRSRPRRGRLSILLQVR
jgi:hypothetical protein